MGVRYVHEDTTEREGERNDRAERTYRRTFSVEMESATDGPEMIFDHEDIPKRFDVYRPASGEDDEMCRCQVVKISPRGRSRIHWTVTCIYTSKTDPSQIDNPLERPPQISYSGTSTAMPVIEDIHGNAILNAAQDPFDPPPDDEEGRQSLRIVVNKSIGDPAPDGWVPDEELLLYNSVNQSFFSVEGVIYKKRHVKFKNSSAIEKWENGTFYWEVTYNFELKKEVIPYQNQPEKRDRVIMYGANREELAMPDEGWLNEETSYAWTKFLLNRGFHIIKDGVKGTPVTNRYGQVYSTPALLNRDGTAKLEAGQAPYYIAYDHLPGVDFTLFGVF